MIAVFRSVAGPWPGQTGPDPHGFRDAADVVATVMRRATDGTASTDDLRRHRVASAALERCARSASDATLAVDADDLVARLLARRSAATDSPPEPFSSACAPEDMAAMRDGYATALAETGPFASIILDFLDAVCDAGRGLVITVQRTPPRGLPILGCTAPPAVRAPVTVIAAPEIAAALALGPSTADIAFAQDKRRLGRVAKLRDQIREAVHTGEPISVGSQAKHEVLTEALRELWYPGGPSGELRILHVDASEAPPFPFAAPNWLAPRGPGSSLRLGLMSMRHTELDPDILGYWFRNRLVSVNRPLAETDAFCSEETERQLHLVAAEGVTDIEMVHTGFEPAVTGFYRAVAAFCSHTPMRIHPHYLTGHGLVRGTTWGGSSG